MISPLTGRSNVIIVESYKVESIVANYLNLLNIDVSSYFSDTDEIHLYRCNDSGYEFYSPDFRIYGDSAFYEKLSRHEWYYSPWKEEFNIALSKIKSSDKVLEIGSGSLDFISKLTKLSISAVGLELNKQSVLRGIENGFDIYPTTVEEFAERTSKKFDFICFFQVLEHISNVKSFLDAAISLLNPGGYLFVSVPNNSSFMKHDKSNAMNLPPHHAGRWNEQSLKTLEKFYPVEIIDVFCENLQPLHYSWYARIMTERFWISRIPYIKSFIKKIFLKIASKNNRGIKGHTISALYKKI